MEPDTIQEIYEGWWGRSGDRGAVRDSDAQWRFLAELLPGARDGRVLDAGSGDGRYAAKLASRRGGPICAVDLVERAASEGFSYLRGSIDGLPFRDRSFDLVYSFSVLYYLGDVAAGIRELSRVLAPGGSLLLTAHAAHSPFTLVRRLKAALGFRSARHLAGVRFPSTGEYLRALGAAGLAVGIVDGFRMLPFVRPRRGPRLRWLARLRSRLAYHCVISARKPAASH